LKSKMSKPKQIDVQIATMQMRKLIVRELRDVLKICIPTMIVSSMNKGKLQYHMGEILRREQHSFAFGLILRKLEARSQKPRGKRQKRKRPTSEVLMVSDSEDSVQIISNINNGQALSSTVTEPVVSQMEIQQIDLLDSDEDLPFNFDYEFSSTSLISIPVPQFQPSNNDEVQVIEPDEFFFPASVSVSEKLSVVVPDALKFIPFPIYDIESEIVKPMSIPLSEPSVGFFKRCSMTFEIPANLVEKLMNSPDDSLPRYEVQLRLALYASEENLSDEFPSNVKITLNGNEVRLPVTIEGTQIKFKPGPLDLTSNCDRTPGASQELSIEWQQDPREFFIGIWIVHHINWALLRQRFFNKEAIQYMKTQEMIQSMLRENSDEILFDSWKVPLICPYTRMKIITPVRSRNCSHIQCFDLNNYLKINILKSVWKCPVCNGSCPYDSLILDLYFVEIIQTVGKDVAEIEFLPDGEWKRIGELQPVDNEQPEETFDETFVEAQTIRKSTQAISLGHTTVGVSMFAGYMEDDQLEILSLDGSDDEDQMEPEIQVIPIRSRTQMLDGSILLSPSDSEEDY